MFVVWALIVATAPNSLVRCAFGNVFRDFVFLQTIFKTNIFPPVTDSNEDVAARMKEAKKPNATLIAFEKLRDTAVENLCKALRAGMRTHEKDIVKALIFSVSNRLYTQQDKAKDAQLMSQNTILTLGHIAVALRHEEKVAYFNWSFCSG